MFLTGVDNTETQKYRGHSSFGLMATPRIGYSNDVINAWGAFAADNGCFTAGDNFNPDKWLAWLARTPTDRCLFAVLPDVVGDHDATLARYPHHLRDVRRLGHRPAFVAQNGCTAATVPWQDIDAVFIGGDDTFKESDDAAGVVREGVARGKWTHVGRVNTKRRMRLVAPWGTHSVDGTVARFDPQRIHRIAAWIDDINTNGSTE